MDYNPYQPPQYEPPPGAYRGTGDRPRIFVLAAVGAWLASAYWAALTLLIGLGVARGGANTSFQVLMPLVLVVLYAVRGHQLYKGDPAAARRILWLHGIGGVFALISALATKEPVMATMQAVKIAIHLFGGITAYLAHRHHAENQHMMGYGPPR